ncbi:unnamed protein product [Parajaminaea phylloscopi]
MSAVVHQSPLLWIPLKQTDEVDVATPVRSLISSSYGEDPKKYASALASLARARTDAVRGAPGSDRTARDLLYKWFHILEMLEVRFPEIRVPFTWKDAFTNKPISQYSLAYEKASVIFNIGATLSAMAAATFRLGGSGASDGTGSKGQAEGPASSPAAANLGAATSSSVEGDGTKRAYTALRQAAGFLTYINDNFLHAPSTDMSRALLRFLVPLLLAQANEVFLEKTLSGKSSPGLVAKLASGVAQSYTALAEESKEWITKEVVDRVWGMMLQAKAKHYSSVAQFQKAQADAAGSQHGHSLVRLTVAENLSKEANKAAQQFASNHTSSGPSASASTTFGYTNHTSSAYTMPSDAGASLAGLVASHLAVVSAARTQAVKDNDLIYHDILPSETALPAIDATSPAQLISIQEVYASAEVQKAVGPDLFSKLVPLGVHERASLYSEEKAKLARAEAERCDLAEGERVAALDGFGLPQALEKFRMATKKTGSSNWDGLVDPGTQVMTWAEEEAAGGAGMGADGLSYPGSKGVNDALSRIDSLRRTANADLTSAVELLDEEARLCEKARAKHGLSWSQEPSGSQPRVKSLRAEIKSNREAFQGGEDNDRRIETSWREVERDVELLIQGRGALEQAFAEAVTSADGPGRLAASQGLSLLDTSESEERASDEALDRLREDVDSLDLALVKLSKVKKERDSLLAELREKLQTDDIGHLLILSHRGGGKTAGAGGEAEDTSTENPQQAAQEAALFRQELAKFRPWQQRLGQAVAAQAHLLSEIGNLWQTINTSAQGKKIAGQWETKSRAKEALVARLGRARASSAEVRAALGKGLQFYDEAGQIARGLKDSAKEWNEQRGRERQRLEGEAEWASKLDSSASTFESKFGGMSLGSSSQSPRSSTGPAPPPLPTPNRQPSYGYGAPPPPPHSFSPSPPPAPHAGPAISEQMQHAYRQSSSYSAPPPPTTQYLSSQDRQYHSPPPPPATSSASQSSGLPPPPPRPNQSAYASGLPPTSSYGLSYGAPSQHAAAPFAYASSGSYSQPQQQQQQQQQPTPQRAYSGNFTGADSGSAQPAGYSSHASPYQPGQYGSAHGNGSGSNAPGGGHFAYQSPISPSASSQPAYLPPPPQQPQVSSGGYHYGAPPSSGAAMYGSAGGPPPPPPPHHTQHRYGAPPPPPPSSQQQHQQQQQWGGYPGAPGR